MRSIEIRKDDVAQDVSAFSVFVDGEEELFVTPLRVDADPEYHEKLMKFVSDSCKYMLAAANLNSNDPFTFADKLSKDMK